MAWRWTGAKSLSEPMIAYFTDTYVSHSFKDFTQWNLNQMAGI